MTAITVREIDWVAMVDYVGLNHVFEIMDRQDLLDYMEAQPDYAGYAMAWGQVDLPGRPWPCHSQYTNGAELVSWYIDSYIRIIGNPPNIPIQQVAQQINPFDPIGYLIAQNQLIPLIRIHEVDRNYFDPFAFGMAGVSYLSLSLQYRSDEIAEYIVGRAAATSNAEFAVGPVHVSQVTGAENWGNHLDLLLDYNKYQLFHDLWNAIQPQNGMYALNQRSKEKLCQLADKAMAESLMHNGLNSGINLAHINLLLGLADSQIGLQTGSSRGTVWHLAAWNPNIDFLDFLHEHTPFSLDWIHGKGCTPLKQAQMHNCYEQFRKFLALGADLNAARLPGSLLDALVLPSDKYLRAVLPLVKHPNRLPPIAGINIPGTNIHVIVTGVNSCMRDIRQNARLMAPQRVRKRRTFMNRANKLIPLVRQGNGNGKPDLNTVNSAGETALALAERFGFHELYYNLQPNPGAVQRAHRYNTRRRA